MAKVRRKAVAVKKNASNQAQKPREEAATGKKVIWRFERVKLPYKPSVPLEVELEADAPHT